MDVLVVLVVLLLKLSELFNQLICVGDLLPFQLSAFQVLKNLFVLLDLTLLGLQLYFAQDVGLVSLAWSPLHLLEPLLVILRKVSGMV